MTNKLHFIYVLKDEHGTVFYVGKTSTPSKRLKRHLAHVRYGSHYPVHNKLRKVISVKGNSNGIYEIIESNVTDDHIDEREMFFIKFYRDQGINLKNLTDGGEGGKGFTPEINKRGALKRTGLKRTLETRKRISDAKTGMKFSNEHKAALKKAWKTRPPMPSDWGKRMSNRTRGKVNIKRFLVEDSIGTLFITEHGLNEFCRQHKLTANNLHKTLSGNRKHHRGWRIIKSLE